MQTERDLVPEENEDFWLTLGLPEPETDAAGSAIEPAGTPPEPDINSIDDVPPIDR